MTKALHVSSLRTHPFSRSTNVTRMLLAGQSNTSNRRQLTAHSLTGEGFYFGCVLLVVSCSILHITVVPEFLFVN